MENIKILESAKVLPVLEESDLQKALEIELAKASNLPPEDVLKNIAQIGRTVKNLTREGGLRRVLVGTYPQLRFNGGSLGNKFTLQTEASDVYTIEYKEDSGEVFLFQSSKKLEDLEYKQALGAIIDSLSSIQTEAVRIDRDD